MSSLRASIVSRRASRSAVLLALFFAAGLPQACGLGYFDGPSAGGSGPISYCEGTVSVHRGDASSPSGARAFDCAPYGYDCVDGECVLPEGGCPAGAKSVCREGSVRGCVAGRVSAVRESCEERGLSCFEVPSGRGTSAVCALEPTPCVKAETGTECVGGQVVSCAHAYPVERTSCAENETCVDLTTAEGGAKAKAGCALAAPCPTPDATLCSGDVIYACEGAPAPRPALDCRTFGEVCATAPGRALCASPGAPAPGAWRQLPSGSFAPGPSDDPAGRVTLAPFEMLETEVTVGSYEACVAAQACTPRDNAEGPGCGPDPYVDLHADLPAACAAYDQALAYCAFVGGTLPSEAEWEYALRNGGTSDEYPWGDGHAGCELTVIADGELAGCGEWRPSRACSRSGDVTEQGVCDLVGNVEEWVTRDDPSSVAGVRGRSFVAQSVEGLREPSPPTSPSPSFARGFRCVRRGTLAPSAPAST